MSNRKWDLTDAACKRINKRVNDLRRHETNNTDEFQDWYMNPMGLLLEAMKPENYARSESAAEELIEIWIRDGEQPWLCSSIFRQYRKERDELRVAGRNVMNGIAAFGEMNL